MNIDFVESPRPSRAAWIVVCGLWGVVAMLAGLHVYLQFRIETQDDARRVAEEQARALVAQPKPRVAPPYQDDAIAALKRAALPEAAAFSELEHVAVAGIQVDSIDDNPSVSTVTVELKAVSDAVLIDYVDQLNAGMPEAMWHLRQVSALDSRPAAATAGNGDGAVDVFTRSATIYRRF